MMIMQSKVVCPKILRDPYLHFLKIHFLAFYWEKDNCFLYEGLKMISNKHFLLGTIYKIKHVWIIFELVFISRNLTATFRTTKMAISQFLHILLLILNSVFYFFFRFRCDGELDGIAANHQSLRYTNFKMLQAQKLYLMMV